MMRSFADGEAHTNGGGFSTISFSSLFDGIQYVVAELADRPDTLTDEIALTQAMEKIEKVKERPGAAAERRRSLISQTSAASGAAVRSRYSKLKDGLSRHRRRHGVNAGTATASKTAAVGLPPPAAGSDRDGSCSSIAEASARSQTRDRALIA